MSVEKAKAAMDAAKALDLDTTDHNGLVDLRAAEQFTHLLSIARTHAEIALAEAAERIADSLHLIEGHVYRKGQP